MSLLHQFLMKSETKIEKQREIERGVREFFDRMASFSSWTCANHRKETQEESINAKVPIRPVNVLLLYSSFFFVNVRKMAVVTTERNLTKHLKYPHRTFTVPSIFLTV